MDALQVVVNILVPVSLSWSAWIANRTIVMEREISMAVSQNIAVLKEIDRLNAEMVVHRTSNQTLASSLARLTAQTEMILQILEQMKRKLHDEKD